MEVSGVSQNTSAVKQEEAATKKAVEEEKQVQTQTQQASEESKQVTAQKTGIGNSINLTG
ncbi:MAG: hypothetical protein OQJ77_07885 [Thiovulaceae bacterium]|nr:hypothetical protein [Sulfurimonadaceae bacterium]MCW9027223.1 hypothetical protein [Sulfurimonadaceae bacterium]